MALLTRARQDKIHTQNPSGRKKKRKHNQFENNAAEITMEAWRSDNTSKTAWPKTFFADWKNRYECVPFEMIELKKKYGTNCTNRFAGSASNATSTQWTYMNSMRTHFSSKNIVSRRRRRRRRWQTNKLKIHKYVSCATHVCHVSLSHSLPLTCTRHYAPSDKLNWMSKWHTDIQTINTTQRQQKISLWWIYNFTKIFIF